MGSAKEALYHHVDTIRESFQLSLSEPLNVVHLLGAYDRFDVTAQDFKNPGLCGIAFAGEKVDTILLNKHRTPIEQNFDCGHELLHLSKHRNKQAHYCLTYAQGQQNSFLEWEANEGAAQLLIPYQDFIPRFLTYFNHPDTSSSYSIQDKLAAHYGVTTQVINIRINSLSYEIDQYCNGVPLQEIQLLSRSQLKKRGITPTHYSALCDFD